MSVREHKLVVVGGGGVGKVEIFIILVCDYKSIYAI